MEELSTITEGQIKIITITRPKALNALNKSLIEEIGAAVQSAMQEDSIFGVIITGEGTKAFAAGADIKGFPSLDLKAASALVQSGNRVFDLIASAPKPVIAVVNGYALGGGLELAMACHMRIANEEAVFGMPEVKLGLIPGYGGTQRLASLIGKAKALEYILTADMMNAAEALDLGLVNHLMASEETLQKAKDIILKISKRGPNAVSAAIQCINLAESDQGYSAEQEHFVQLMLSSEAREGVSAFLEKRKANFR